VLLVKVVPDQIIEKIRENDGIGLVRIAPLLEDAN